MKSKGFYLGLIVVIAAVQFFVSNHTFRGYLRSEVFLGKELKTHRDSLYQYKLVAEAPFKYRLLFPSIVKGTYAVLYASDDALGFYQVYKGWSLFFYVTAAVACFFFLSVVGFQQSWAFAGALIFLWLPPVLLAYSLPVHTREDMLAYTLMFAGLSCLVQQRWWWMLAVALLGALCRETLLLLPLMYFLFGRDPQWWRRFLIAGLPVALWLSIRVGMPHQPYDTWEGLRWNLNNPEQVVGFLFITFNVLWLAFAVYVRKLKRYQHAPEPLGFFYRSAWAALLIILITTFVGGIYNEIRLLYLFAPWMIVIALTVYREYAGVIAEVRQHRAYVLYTRLVTVGSVIGLGLLLKYQEKIITPGRYAVPYYLWITVSVVYIMLLLWAVPPVYRILSKSRQS